MKFYIIKKLSILTLLILLFLSSCKQKKESIESNIDVISKQINESVGGKLYVIPSYNTEQLQPYVKLRTQNKIKGKDIHILANLAFQRPAGGILFEKEFTAEYLSDSLSIFFSEPTKEELLKRKKHESYWLKVNNSEVGLCLSAKIEHENNKTTLSIKHYAIDNLDSIVNNNKSNEPIDYKKLLKKEIDTTLVLSKEHWIAFKQEIHEMDFWNITNFVNYSDCRGISFILEGFRSDILREHKVKDYNLIEKTYPADYNIIWKICQRLLHFIDKNGNDMNLRLSTAMRF